MNDSKIRTRSQVPPGQLGRVKTRNQGRGGRRGSQQQQQANYDQLDESSARNQIKVKVNKTSNPVSAFIPVPLRSQASSQPQTKRNPVAKLSYSLPISKAATKRVKHMPAAYDMKKNEKRPDYLFKCYVPECPDETMMAFGALTHHCDTNHMISRGIGVDVKYWCLVCESALNNTEPKQIQLSNFPNHFRTSHVLLMDGIAEAQRRAGYTNRMPNFDNTMFWFVQRSEDGVRVPFGVPTLTDIDVEDDQVVNPSRQVLIDRLAISQPLIANVLKKEQNLKNRTAGDVSPNKAIDPRVSVGSLDFGRGTKRTSKQPSVKKNGRKKHTTRNIEESDLVVEEQSVNREEHAEPPEEQKEQKSEQSFVDLTLEDHEMSQEGSVATLHQPTLVQNQPNPTCVVEPEEAQENEEEGQNPATMLAGTCAIAAEQEIEEVVVQYEIEIREEVVEYQETVISNSGIQTAGIQTAGISNNISPLNPENITPSAYVSDAIGTEHEPIQLYDSGDDEAIRAGAVRCPIPGSSTEQSANGATSGSI